MHTKRALAFIFCTVTLDVLALGLMIPVLPEIVLGFRGGDTAGAAEVFGAFATAWRLMQLAVAPSLTLLFVGHHLRDHGSGRGRPQAGWLPGHRQLPSGGCELAHQPVRLERIIEPRLGPALVQATAHGGRRDGLAVEIEQRKLAARLAQSAPEVEQL